MTLGRPVDDPSEFRRSLLRVFTDLSPPRAVGKKYLEIHPGEANVNFLTMAIFGNAGALGTKKITRLLQERCAMDFENNDTVILQGWILARSEVRVCALVSLL